MSNFAGGSCPYDHLTIYDKRSDNDFKLTISSYMLLFWELIHKTVDHLSNFYS